MKTCRQRICGLLKLHLNIRRDVPITKTTRIFTGNAVEQISCALLKIISLKLLFFLLLKCKAVQGENVTSYCRTDLIRRAESIISTERRKIRLIEGNEKCCDPKKFTCKETLRQEFICLRSRTSSTSPPPSPTKI